MNEVSPSETQGWWNRSCVIQKSLDGKISIVTGANTGHGLALTGELARRGSHVIMACRSLKRANAGRKKLLEQNGSCNSKKKCDRGSILPEKLQVELLDLSSFESIKDFVQRVQAQYDQIHYLFNNAGTVCEYAISTDGHEMTMAVNHLGHVLLTMLLLPLLHAGTPSRIICIGSRSQYLGRLQKPDLLIPRAHYGPFAAYCQSKLAVGVFANELGQRLSTTGITVAYVDPGPINTEIGRNINNTKAKFMKTLMRWFFKSPEKGMQTAIYAALSDNVQPGGFYFNCHPCYHGEKVQNELERRWLFDKSCELVGIQSTLTQLLSSAT